jgi:CopG family nickel-responsive transcriptional regulator
MPQDLLARFDQLVARRGMNKNRSELMRDLVRQALVEEQWSDPDPIIVGTLSLVFDNSAADVPRKLDQIQHTAHDKIISTMHIHLDAQNCLEVIAMQGKSADITSIAESLLGVKGVKHGCLSSTTTGGAL